MSSLEFAFPCSSRLHPTWAIDSSMGNAGGRASRMAYDDPIPDSHPSIVACKTKIHCVTPYYMWPPRFGDRNFDGPRDRPTEVSSGLPFFGETLNPKP